jgi:pyruvate,water dikinase
VTSRRHEHVAAPYAQSVPPWRRDAALRSSASFRLQYERFRQLLALNDRMLQLFADIEDQLSHRRRSRSTPRYGGSARPVDVFVMAKNLNQITSGRFPSSTMRSPSSPSARQRAPAPARATPGRWWSRFPSCGRATPLAGAKMRTWEVERRVAGLPPGSPSPPHGFGRFMERTGCGPLRRAEGLLEANGPSALNEGCAEVRAAMLGSVVPADVAEAVAAASAAAFADDEVLLAVRSSAVGEDGSATSHAGIYHSELHVPRERLLDSYREVVASAFTPAAVSYRYARGLTAGDSSMAVGCLRMVDVMASGIMFSRPPESPAEDLVVISGSRGIAAGIALGTEDASIWTGPPAGPFAGGDTAVGEADLRRLAGAARQLEEHFGSAQDVEWAIDTSGRLIVLQTRPMVTIAPGTPQESSPLDELELLVEGGLTACPGVAAGPVVPVRGEADLAEFPDGGVRWPTTRPRSSTGHDARCHRHRGRVADRHMAILARSTIARHRRHGRRGARPEPRGDGDRRRAKPPGVRRGAQEPARGRAATGAARLAGDPRAALHRGARGAPPPHEPGLPGLRAAVLPHPARHDPLCSREGFRGHVPLRRRRGHRPPELLAPGGAAADRHPRLRRRRQVAADAPATGRISPRDILSVPMLAFLEGMLDGRISWSEPRPVSVRGFLSVLGESMTGPPPDAQQLGRLSYAILSDRYLNFSTKAGYHFSTIDTYCGRSANKNYIHFRFSGGAADEMRRRRRVRFIRRVLEALDFRVDAGGDILHARLDKYEPEVIRQRLADLGRLTLCARQLDMLMGSDESPERYAQDFLSGR